MGNRFDTDVHVGGQLSADTMIVPDNAVRDSSIDPTAEIQRTKLKLETKTCAVNLTTLRVHDAIQTVLPNPSASDDLGLYGGTFATNAPYVATYDVKNAGAQTLRARFMFQIPPEYEAGENITLRLRSGMMTTVASTSCTIDAEAFLSDRFGGVTGGDLCATAAQSMNALGGANKDFTLTGTTLSPGQWLDVRISVAVNDAATVTAVIAKLGSIEMLVPLRG